MGNQKTSPDQKPLPKSQSEATSVTLSFEANSLASSALFSALALYSRGNLGLEEHRAEAKKLAAQVQEQVAVSGDL